MTTNQHVDVAVMERALQVAVGLATDVGAMQRESVGQTHVITHKGAVDLVTDVDIKSEQQISAGLIDAFPDFQLSGEEGAIGADTGSWRWLVDPIDGTTNFAHGVPHWAISICLEYEGEPVVGVVYDVAKDEMFTAVKGGGAFLNGEPIRVSGVDQLMRGLGATGVSYDIPARAPGYRLWQTLNDGSQAMRRNGAAALDMAWVACGRFDFYVERPIHNWDIAAGVIIAQEAGGTVTAMDGGRFSTDLEEVCASNGLLHDDLVRLIATADMDIDNKRQI